MAERKVINKVRLCACLCFALALTVPQYYPPDFDPALLPRTKKLKNKQQTVNMMMPMSVTCTSCGNYIYRGTKFNSMKETVQGEDYLGIRIFRFYMRCPNCSSEFTIRTDPKNADYSVELGCTVSTLGCAHNVTCFLILVLQRQMEPWKQADDLRDALLEKRVGDEGGDAMKELENKTLDSKMEMDILDGLDEIKALNARASSIKVDDILAKRAEEDERLGQEDELVLLETFEGRTKRLLHAEDDVNVDALLTRRKRRTADADSVPPSQPASVPAPPPPKPGAPVVVVEAKKPRKLVNY